jgi:hypothetical protein
MNAGFYELAEFPISVYPTTAVQAASLTLQITRKLTD